MTAFRKFSRPEERGSHAAAATRHRPGVRGLTTVGNLPPSAVVEIRLGAFDADQILACVLSIGGPRHAIGAAARFGKSY